jgi:hypothetical protein
VHHHPAPTGADVEQPLSRAQIELAAHKVKLVRLGLVQCLVGEAKDRARIGHRGTEQELVEAVREVVVVRYGRRVPCFGVRQQATPPARRRLLLGNGWPAEAMPIRAAQRAQSLALGGAFVRGGGVRAAPRVDRRARPACRSRSACQSKLAGSAQDVTQGQRRADLHDRHRVIWTGDASVVRPKRRRRPVVDKCREDVCMCFHRRGGTW